MIPDRLTPHERARLEFARRALLDGYAPRLVTIIDRLATGAALTTEDRAFLAHVRRPFGMADSSELELAEIAERIGGKP